MSAEKKQGDENWRDATAKDVERVMAGETVEARFRDWESVKWVENGCSLAGWCAGVWTSSSGLSWVFCQVYREPTPTRSPKDGCRMSDEKKQGEENWRDATPDDVFKVLQGQTARARVKEEANENWVSTDVDGYDLHITGWHRDKFIDSEGSHWSLCQVYVESGPPSSIGLTYDPWTDTVSKIVRTDASGKVVESISAPWKPLVGEEVRFVNPNHSKKGTIGRIKSVTKKGYLFQADNSRFGRWCDLSELEKFDRPVPKGFRMLSDEPRLASDGYWSLSCKDWLVIGDRVEEANRDKWPAIRFVVEEPEPVKQFGIVNAENGDQAMAEVNQTATGNYEFTTRDSQHLRELKIELYRKLLSMPVSILTDNEIDLQLFLSRDSAIQDELKAELDAKATSKYKATTHRRLE